MRDLANWILVATTITLSVTVFAVKCSSAESMSPQSTWSPRPVGAEELQKSRGKVEDRLHTNVLGAFTDREQLTRIRNILNGPWDKEAVDNLASFVLDNTPLQGKVTIQEWHWRAVANMIAYVGKEYPETAAGTAAKEVLDKFIERAILIDRRRTVMACFWLVTTDAIARYGSARLLTESFWKGLEQGLWAPKVLESVADEGVLKRLASIRAQNPWPKVPAIKALASDAMFVIEMQLEYPELKQMTNINMRFDLGKMLQRSKEATKITRAKVIEKYAEESDIDDCRRVLNAISARLKKEAGDSPQNM